MTTLFQLLIEEENEQIGNSTSTPILMETTLLMSSSGSDGPSKTQNGMLIKTLKSFGINSFSSMHVNGSCFILQSLEYKRNDFGEN